MGGVDGGCVGGLVGWGPRPGAHPPPLPAGPCLPHARGTAPPMADHGAPGILGMPSGPFLYADQLHAVLKAKARKQGFAEMVL